MSHLTLVNFNFSELTTLLSNFCSENSKTLERIGIEAAKSLKGGGTIFWCGNGGSAADSQHLSAELVGRFLNNRDPLSSVSLNSDVAALTCISNDFGYDHVFSRQLEALAQKGDLVIALSTSGNSQNVIKCLLKAKEIGVMTVALLGKRGGQTSSLADFEIIVNSESTARIQEVHKIIGHTICQIVERELGITN